MISTFFHLSPLPTPANLFSSGDNSMLSPSCIRFRQSVSFSVAATSYTSVAVSASPASFYEILGIPIGATIKEIKAAYRRLARLYHPDVAAISQKDSYADEFMKIRAAYCTLSNPNKRALYDRSLFPTRRSGNLSSAAYTRRNWETDQCW